MAVQVGQPAPDFKLKGVVDGDFVDVKLSDYRGKWVVLFFYPLDFTFVCPTEIQGFAKHNDEFVELGAQVLGASVDSEHSHKAWIERDFGSLPFPLLSDLRHEATEAYGVLLPATGIALRGTFIIDPEGTLKYAVVHDNNIGRNTDETLRVLQALQTGELCPVDWRPGQATLS
jgi:peroxiredoxin 2/4